MTDQAKKYLSDILKVIRLIEEFIEETETFEAYQSSKLIKSAVERQLGIIGEAVNKFQKLGESFEITATKQIINFRNRIILKLLPLLGQKKQGLMINLLV